MKVMFDNFLFELLACLLGKEGRVQNVYVHGYPKVKMMVLKIV